MISGEWNIPIYSKLPCIVACPLIERHLVPSGQVRNYIHQHSALPVQLLWPFLLLRDTASVPCTGGTGI